MLPDSLRVLLTSAFLMNPGLCFGQTLIFHARDYVEPYELAEAIQDELDLRRTPRVVLQDVPTVDEMVELTYGDHPGLLEYFRRNPAECPPAYADPKGTIYVHTSNPYYYEFPRPGTRPVAERVRAVIVHHAIHAASVNRIGFIGTGEGTSPSSSLNEAVTEHFASKVFSALYEDDYRKFTSFWFDKRDQGKVDSGLVRIWAGHHIPVMLRELEITEAELTNMYFEFPYQFERLVGKDRDTPRGRALREAWLKFLPAASQ